VCGLVRIRSTLLRRHKPQRTGTSGDTRRYDECKGGIPIHQSISIFSFLFRKIGGMLVTILASKDGYLPTMLHHWLRFWPNRKFKHFNTILHLHHAFHTSPLSSWYFGKMSCAQSVKLLKHPKNQTGTFLIRDSDSQSGQYALSVLYNDSVKQYRIRTLDLGGYFIRQSLEFE
jgi:SH2 domain